MSTQQFKDADRIGCEGVGGEFERALRRERSKTDNQFFHNTICNLEKAHNADRAADKQRIAVLEAQLAAAQKPRVMKRWGVDGVPAPGVMCWLLVGGIMHKEGLSSEEIMQCRIAGCAIHGKITHWLELEPAPTLPEPSDDMSSLVGDGDA